MNKLLVIAGMGLFLAAHGAVTLMTFGPIPARRTSAAAATADRTMGERFSKMKKLLILVAIALVLAAFGAVLSVHPIVVA
jgi:hypothetical protein